jgi:hypothetical protein
MKKLVLFFAAVLITAVSANVFAQSTGETPAPGATHSYSITPGDGANTITWTVWKGNLTTPAGSDAVITASTSAATDIAWGTDLTVGDWYYVMVVESDGSCSNTKVLPVQIMASPFYLTLAASNATSCYDGAVTVSLTDESTPSYDHGNTTIVFTVTPTGFSSSYEGYKFVLADLDVPTGFNATAEFSSNASESGGTVTVSDNNLVTITYTVDNTNAYTNASAANAQDYTATAVISSGVANNGVSDNNTDGTYTDATAVSRPNTSGISTN